MMFSVEKIAQNSLILLVILVSDADWSFPFCFDRLSGNAVHCYKRRIAFSDTCETLTAYHT
ncbi:MULTISPECIES: hypothetical protein [Psychrobacter]|jgi:hypothetical protein|uniref:hypothetical protein n=1 Tax=Psychrobacter TaxID=497 RepID=UPI0004119620|nr:MULTISPECIES: hypothetical protein [Psychrobacter]NRD70505.1 hypothetical protein [Psychrobacter okhotskensis]